MTRLALMVALIACCPAVGGAADLTLPGGVALPRRADSPGPVTFFHETHVDAQRPNCTACHPKLFPMLKGTRRPRIGHQRFEAGELCASCHDGRKAFAIADGCSNCHQS